MKDILNQVETNDLSARKAYRLLYKKRKRKKARFMKIGITIPEGKGINIFLKVILFLPIPMFLIRLIARKSLKDEDVATIKLANEALKYKPLSVVVKTHSGEKVKIRAI